MTEHEMKHENPGDTEWDIIEAEIERSTAAKVDLVLAQLPPNVRVWRSAGSAEATNETDSRDTVTESVVPGEGAGEADVLIADVGEVYVLVLQSGAACDWVTEYLDIAEERWLTDLEFTVGHKEIGRIVVSAQAAGLQVGPDDRHRS